MIDMKSKSTIVIHRIVHRALFDRHSILSNFNFRLHHINNNALPFERAGRMLVLVTCWAMTILVCISRVYLLYHTIGQVIVGGILGIITGTCYFMFVHIVVTPFLPYVVSW